MRKTFVVILVVAILVSGYFVFQSANVLAHNNFSRSLMVATRLLSIEFVDISPTAIESGYFTILITFENPSTQALNITEIVAEYYESQGESGRAVVLESTKLLPGKTPIVLRMDLILNASFVQPFDWIVYYRLEFGPAQYWFRYITYDSRIETIGPYSIGGDDPAVAQVMTYSLAVVDVWAVGLEMIAVLFLFGERRSVDVARMAQDKEHRQMLAIIYSLEGIGFFAFFPFVSFIISLMPPTEAYSSAGGWVIYLYVGLAYLVGLIFVLTALGLLSRKRSAMYAAGFFSSVSVFVSLCACISILMFIATAQDFALFMLSLAVLAANVMALYMLLKRKPLPKSLV